MFSYIQRKKGENSLSCLVFTCLASVDVPRTVLVTSYKDITVQQTEKFVLYN